MYHMKYVLLGDSGVGKSAILWQFTQVQYQTLGIDYASRTLNRARIHIWDIAGMPRFRPIVPLYTHSATVIVLVYDIGNRDSYDTIQHYWLPRLHTGTKQTLVLVGNKVYGPRVVSFEEGQLLSMKRNIMFYEVCDSSVDQVFLESSRYVLDKIDNGVLLPAYFTELGIRYESNVNSRCCP